MRKQLTIMACASTALFGATATNLPDQFDGGVTLGMSTTTALNDGEYYLTAGYINNYFLFDFGVNYEHIKVDATGVGKNVFSFQSHLGLRNRLQDNLFITYGINGSVSAVNPNPRQNPFSAGVFTGLDLQIQEHYLLSVKIYPFSYEQIWDGNHYIGVFESGTFQVAYVF